MTDEWLTVWFRLFIAAQCVAAAVLLLLKNKKRWRRTSENPLSYGARLWREGLLVLFLGLAFGFIWAATHRLPATPSSIYMVGIMALIDHGMFAEYRFLKKQWAIRDEARIEHRRRFDDV